MSQIIKDAESGQKKALTYLYSANKNKAFFIAQNLLENENDVSEAVANAFERAIGSITNEGIECEKDFEALILRSLGLDIRSLAEKRSVSYKTPADRNFMIVSKIDISDSESENADLVFASLTPLQKLIFLFLSVGSLGKKDIAFASGLDLKTAEVLIDAVKSNIKRISNDGFDFDKLAAVFSKRAVNESITEDCDKKVKAIIDDLSKENEALRKNKAKKIIALAVAVCIIIAATIGVCIFKYSDDFNAEGVYRAKIVVEDYGTITIDMDAKNAPITVENFFNLVKSDFYDGLTFHRISPDYLIHGGSPDKTNWGASENAIYGEFSENGFENGLSHTRGVISMARPDDYNSASCQFFILKADMTEIDGKFAAFGKVVRGMEIVDKMCEDAKPIDTNNYISEQKQPVIKKITISRIR